MELLLWMWFYDPRWFFNIRIISINFYKFTWLIPLMAHIWLVCYCIYLITYTSYSEVFSGCDKSVILWALSRIFFSFFISITIIIFMFKISFVFNREKKYFENAENIYPALKGHLDTYNFWIRRKSLISTPGIFLLFLGLISLFWSYLMIKMYYFERLFDKCENNLISFLNLNNMFIFFGNIPLLVLLIVVCFVKINYICCAFLCPKTYIWLSKIKGTNTTNNSTSNFNKKKFEGRNNKTNKKNSISL